MSTTDQRHQPRTLSLTLTAALLLAFVPVAARAAQTPYLGSPVQLPGTIQAENYDNGGEGVAYHDTTSGNVFNVYRTAEDMDVGAIPPASGGGFHIGFVEPDEWAEYTVNVPVTQAYEVRLWVSSNHPGPNTFHLELDGSDVSGSRSVPFNGAWHDYQLLTIPAVTLTAGSSRILRVSFDAGHFNLDRLEIRGQAPWGGTPTSLPTEPIQAEDYDLGGEGIAYHDTTAGNVFGVYRTDEDMDVGAIPPASGAGFHIGFLANGEWAEYTVNVTQSQNYEMAMRIASDTPLTTRFRVLLDGNDISGAQTVTATGGWHNYIEKVFPVGFVAAGNFRVLRLSFELGAFNLDWLELRPVAPPQCDPPTITQHPTGFNLPPQGEGTLRGAASGTPTIQYQWLKDNVPIPGATQPSYEIEDAREDDIGSYRLKATNSCGTATSNAAQVTVDCNGPASLVQSLAEVLRGNSAVCNWRPKHNANFPNSLGNGSYNIPVVAAAIALVVDPNMAGPDPQNPGVAGWWRKYLKGELGERGNEWYFGGKEPFSGVYQNYNIAAVLGVHYQAHRAGLTDVRDLARRWLRATFALSAAAAAPDRALTLHDRGTVCTPWASNYNGPYLPMAGMRSGWFQWGLPDRAIFYASAVGISHNGSGEKPGNANLRDFLQDNWNGPGGSEYGLTKTEAVELAAIRSTGQLPAGFSSMIAGIRTIKTYRILAWPGVRVTLLEQNANGNTPPTYGVAYFSAPRDAGGKEAHFLYPWRRGTGSNPCQGGTPGSGGFPAGEATLNLNGRFMTASQPGTQPQNPAETVTIDNLPVGTHQYQIVLSP